MKRHLHCSARSSFVSSAGMRQVSNTSSREGRDSLRGSAKAMDGCGRMAELLWILGWADQPKAVIHHRKRTQTKTTSSLPHFRLVPQRKTQKAVLTSTQRNSTQRRLSKTWSKKWSVSFADAHLIKSKRRSQTKFMPWTTSKRQWISSSTINLSNLLQGRRWARVAVLLAKNLACSLLLRIFRRDAPLL